MGLYPGVVYWMDIFHIDLLVKLYFCLKRPKINEKVVDPFKKSDSFGLDHNLVDLDSLKYLGNRTRKLNRKSYAKLFLIFQMGRLSPLLR